MNNRLRELAERAGLDKERWNTTEQFENFLQRFSEQLVEHILLKVEAEIALAYDQDQGYAGATMSALALEILDDFDMEIKDDDIVSDQS